MIPIEFEESNFTFLKPDSMSEEECSSLPVYRDGTHIISCWQLTAEEIEVIAKTGKLWIWVFGQSTPPVCATAHSPFIEQGDTELSVEE